MNPVAIFWPMIAHALLVYIIYGLTSRRRIAAVKAGNAKASQFRENLNEPAESLTAHNNLLNQFQLPVLFHVVCLSLYVTNGVSVVPLVLAWLFILARYAHAFIHVTTNRLRHRRPVFMFGYFVLGILWIWFALHLLAVV